MVAIVTITKRKEGTKMIKKVVSLVMYLMIVTPFVSAAYSEDVSYTKHIKPLLDAKCLTCHGVDAPEYVTFKEQKKKYEEMGKGPRMDTYTHLIYFIGWPDSGALMRRLDDGKNAKDGKPGNMYQYLGLTEDERQKNLVLFKEWVGNWTLKRWADITKEDMDGLKLRY
jgi:hypothetical protein